MEQACEQCPKGSYCQSGNRFGCPKGTYNDAVERASVGECKSCPKDSYNDETEATAESSCKTCQPDATTGKSTTTKTDKSQSALDCQVIAFSCPESGQRPISDTKCENCPTGTYGDDRGESCVLCPTGYYQSATKQTKCDRCTTADTCSAMLGATSQNALDLPLEYASVFAHIDNNGTRGGGSKVTDDNEPLDEKLEIPPTTTTPLYIALFIIVLVNVALHRFCPMSFKKADVLFAGDHFIDDSVSDCCVRCVRVLFALLSCCICCRKKQHFNPKHVLCPSPHSTRNECWTRVWVPPSP